MIQFEVIIVKTTSNQRTCSESHCIAKRMKAFLLLVFIPVVMGYVNDFDQSFSFQCPAGHSISNIFSTHDNRREDRKYGFKCHATPNLGNCRLSGYVNNFDDILLYQCPSDGVIAGVSSYHDNRREDRRFQFYCCPLTSGKRLVFCSFSGFVNSFDAFFNYVVPKGRVLKGAFSYHSNRHEDRRWRFETCLLV